MLTLLMQIYIFQNGMFLVLGTAAIITLEETEKERSETAKGELRCSWFSPQKFEGIPSNY